MLLVLFYGDATAFYPMLKHIVKREYLVAILYLVVFSNMTIWQRINLAISNTAIYKDCNVKYVSNNVYSDNNHGQPQSILNIFLTFCISLYFMTTLCGLFSV